MSTRTRKIENWSNRVKPVCWEAAGNQRDIRVNTL
jgi:hypothetical protein